MTDKIDKIELRNYRVLPKMDVEFDPHITTLIGNSFKGKSTIIGALRWVALNRPIGSKIISWGADAASVRVTMDGKKITRKRSKSVNLYKYQGQEFKAFSNDVPPEIASRFNLSELNFQRQFIAPFWFCESAGEVSRQLNSIIDLKIIDTTLATIASRLRKGSTAIEVIEDNLKEAVAKRKSLKFIKQKDKDLRVLEGKNTAVEDSARESALLKNHLETLYEYKTTMEEERELRDDAALVVTKGDEMVLQDLAVSDLSRLIEEAMGFTRAIRKKPPPLTHLEKLKGLWEELNEEQEELEESLTLLQIKEEEVCKTTADFNRCKKQLDKLAEGRCPLCQKPM